MFLTLYAKFKLHIWWRARVALIPAHCSLTSITSTWRFLLQDYKTEPLEQYLRRSKYSRWISMVHSTMAYAQLVILKPMQIGYLAMDIIEWGWVGYEEFCRSRRVLSTEAEGGGG